MGQPTVPDEIDRAKIEAIHAASSPADIAAWVADQVGGELSQSYSTESGYVVCHGHEIRFSNHSKYASVQPMHVRCGVPAYKLLSRIRIAVIAARNGGLRNYAHVRKIISAKAVTDWKSGATRYQYGERAARLLASI